MTGAISVLSWNLQGEVGISEDRLQHQLDFLDTHTADIDLFLFQAVNSEEGQPGDWAGHLGALLEYFADRDYHAVHTGDWAQELVASTVQPHAGIEGTHNRCNLTASRWPIERRPLTIRNLGDGIPQNLNSYYSHFPEKILVGVVDTSANEAIGASELAVWNVGIVSGAGWGEEKLNMLETVYGRLCLETKKNDLPIVLGGDFNAPKEEMSDQEIVPHGANKAQLTDYPFYGDPHYLRESDGEIEEYRFDRRWNLAEARIFDPEIGDWGMRDAYWAAEESPRAASTEDYTHEISNAVPLRKRLDHLLVSNQFVVDRCEIWNGVWTETNGFRVSDHAPVFARIRLRS